MALRIAVVALLVFISVVTSYENYKAPSPTYDTSYGNYTAPAPCPGAGCAEAFSPQIGTVASLTKEWAKHGYPAGAKNPYLISRIDKNGVATMTKNGLFELKGSCLYALWTQPANGQPGILEFHAPNLPAAMNPVYKFIGNAIDGQPGTIYTGQLVYKDGAHAGLSFIVNLTDSKTCLVVTYCHVRPTSNCFYTVQPLIHPKLGRNTTDCINENLKENHFSMDDEVHIDYSNCTIPGLVL